MLTNVKRQGGKEQGQDGRKDTSVRQINLMNRQIKLRSREADDLMNMTINTTSERSKTYE